MKLQKPHAAGDDATPLTVQHTTRLSDFSTRVVYKLARSHAERDAIFKLRYRSYVRTGLTTANSFGRYIEPADHAANAHLVGLRIGQRLVSSLRLQIGTATSTNFSSLALFPDLLGPLVKSSKTVVDMSCVATEGESPPTDALLPYLVLRAWIVAAEHFHADYISAAVRPQHQIFYKRALGCDLHSELRQLPHQQTSVGLVTLNFVSLATQLYEKLPFLRSTAHEQQELFGQEQPHRGSVASFL
jgi:hypothetical protein